MQWLAERCPTPDFPDLTDDTPAGRAAIIEMLTKVCVRMRAHGLRGAWHYSLPLHTEVFCILTEEELSSLLFGRNWPPSAAPQICRPSPAAGGKGGRLRARDATGLAGDCPTREALTQTRRYVMAQAFDSLSPTEAGGNDCQPFPPQPKSYDYRHQHELNWGDIEVEIANIRNGAKAVECMADADTEFNGTDITAALRFICVGLEARIDRLKELLGLGEVHP